MLLPTLPLYLAAFNIGTTQIGLVMSIFAIGLLGSRPYIGKFIDQYGARCTLRYGGGILTVYTLLYAVAPASVFGGCSTCRALSSSRRWSCIMLSPPGGIRAAFTCGLLGDFRPRFRHLGGSL